MVRGHNELPAVVHRLNFRPLLSVPCHSFVAGSIAVKPFVVLYAYLHSTIIAVVAITVYESLLWGLVKKI